MQLIKHVQHTEHLQHSQIYREHMQHVEHIEQVRHIVEHLAGFIMEHQLPAAFKDDSPSAAAAFSELEDAVRMRQGGDGAARIEERYLQRIVRKTRASIALACGRAACLPGDTRP